ncbi:MAG: hypothetical protein O7A64_01740 [Alphaproteobacteria bacterium]|nr:hypothetical protein [Alphaproteobacteria bacterium]
MMSWPKALAASLAVVLAAACAAPTRWENPGVPRDRWPGDKTACRVQATAEAERDYIRGRGYRIQDDDTRADPLRARMARFDALKKRGTLFARCMRARGYREVKKSGGRGD